MNIWIVIITAYLATGAAMAVVGPVARERRRDALRVALANVLRDPPVPRWRFAAYAVVKGALIVVLWPLALAAELEKSRPRLATMEGPAPQTRQGLRFEHMGGVGMLRCADCHSSKEVRSFTHGFDGSHTSGYQCQSCGAFHAVDYEPAFRTGTPEADAMFSLSMVKLIESQMAKTPRGEWLMSWEADLAKHRRCIEGIDFEPIHRKQTEVAAAFDAKLVCSCGGALSRDEVVVCPSCRSRSVSYRMRYIT